MSDVTQILSAIEQGDRQAADQLLPLVYQELRNLAAARMAGEKPGQTLQATALVHEAYVRLVGANQAKNWDNRGHFFAAAADAMRKILVENARRKKRIKRGGDMTRRELDPIPIASPEIHEDLIALDIALERLKSVDAQAAALVHLRYFAGLSNSEAAEHLHISARTAGRVWSFARAWLRREIARENDESKKE